MTEYSIDELVVAYMNVRERRQQISDAFEAEDAELKEVQNKLKASLLFTCNNLSVDSLKTKHGTVIRQIKERYWTQDWEEFHKFVVENQIPQLLEKRIAQNNMKAYLAEHNGEGLPPGVNVLKEFDITIRKPVKQ